MPKIDQDALTRSMTGIVFLIVMISGILLSNFTVLLLFSIIVGVASYEFGGMTSSASGVLMPLSATGFFFCNTSLLSQQWSWILLAISVVLLMIPQGVKSYLSGLTLRILGVILIAGSFSLLLSPEIMMQDRKGILAFFIVLWTYDSLAYVSGRLMGKHKLWARISPGKTWEGFIGGLLCACLVSYALSTYAGYSPITSIIIGVLISVFGTLGDLLESSFKRKAGVKDSGSFMPGHGGMLDRFDGVMLAVPAVFIFLRSIAIG